MGKQLNYYIGYTDFRKIAQEALCSGCEILKRVNGKYIRSNCLDIVTPDVCKYFFYLPDAGLLVKDNENGEERIGGYTASGNVVIEASFSTVNQVEMKISRARIFSITGFYDKNGVWIDRPECLKKVYEKLVRSIKKLAPYTEIVDVIVSSCDDSYNQQKEWKHKEYISPELLALKLEQGYKIGL